MVSSFVGANAFMNEDDTEGITLHLLIAFAPTKDETINLDIKGNEDEIVHLEQSTIQLKTGQKEATVKVISNTKHLLSVPKTLSISVGNTSNPRIKAFPTTESATLFVIFYDAQSPLCFSQSTYYQ